MIFLLIQLLLPQLFLLVLRMIEPSLPTFVEVTGIVYEKVVFEGASVKVKIVDAGFPTTFTPAEVVNVNCIYDAFVAGVNDAVTQNVIDIDPNGKTAPVVNKSVVVFATILTIAEVATVHPNCDIVGAVYADGIVNGFENVAVLITDNVPLIIVVFDALPDLLCLQLVM